MCSITRQGTREIRIRMKPGETLVLRVVRERTRDYEHLGYGEFETLPAWEYEETIHLASE